MGACSVRRDLKKKKSRISEKILNTVLELIKSGYDSIDKIMDTAARNQTEKFSSIEGFGEITARLMIRHFSDPNNIEMIETLKKIGLNFQEHSKSEPEFPMVFSGQIWAITGSFHHFSPRSQAAVEIEKRGGKVSDSISGKTTHLLCGDSPGGKLEKTKNLNIRIVREDEFMEMLI
jgi:DNA ligase (NAD+)